MYNPKQLNVTDSCIMARWVSSSWCSSSNRSVLKSTVKWVHNWILIKFNTQSNIEVISGWSTSHTITGKSLPFMSHVTTEDWEKMELNAPGWQIIERYNWRQEVKHAWLNWHVFRATPGSETVNHCLGSQQRCLHLCVCSTPLHGWVGE